MIGSSIPIYCNIAIIDHERGIPSKRESSAQVPALCTHRPSLLPIEWFSEIFGLNIIRQYRMLFSLRYN